MLFIVLFSCFEDKNTSDELSNDDPISPIGHLKLKSIIQVLFQQKESIALLISSFGQNTSDYTLDIGELGSVMSLDALERLTLDMDLIPKPDGDNICFENIKIQWIHHTVIFLKWLYKIARDIAEHKPYSELSHFDAHFETCVGIHGEDSMIIS